MNFEVLKKYWISAKKSLGQNFLMDENILNSIASSLDISWKNILEIGPWYGALTEKLLIKNPKSLHLVELDKRMVEILEYRIKDSELKPNNVDFKIFNEDILKFEPWFIDEHYYVIANIPYYITSPILQKFLYDVKLKPDKMVILMQKDVGDKILAGQLSNSKQKSSVLSLFISKKCFVRSIVLVPPTCFYPAPKVESEVLLFESHSNYQEINDKKILSFIKKWFQNPRKKLTSNLEKWWYKKEKIKEIFDELKISENTRWEELNIDEWIELFKNF